MSNEVPNMPNHGRERAYTHSGELYRMIGEDKLTVDLVEQDLVVYLGDRQVGALELRAWLAKFNGTKLNEKLGTEGTVRICAPGPARWILEESKAKGYWKEV
jgi:hypothetical protein